ncbi:polymorphic toxin-type HINT domain-containing protein [Blastopirellula marina]|uniref:Intein C-terminal splicing domain-containing protein n=1 Tax=Blastopirellula marina DSM 3645 TaxID=314230 RepID=A3ZWE4_9BACT|nr:polymorphic toxin-type HINT domain-containing protein [Blastopirellula marina]EAQ79172.1 hypothetical protein DSM3645_26154 [Blastopirellula marina DSM 3645]
MGEIRPGERVQSFDFASGEWKLRTVTDRIDSLYRGAVLTIDTGDSRIETTIHHPFWVVQGHELTFRSTPRLLSGGEDERQALPGRWVNSHELQAGDIIYSRDGKTRIIRSIHQRYEDAFPVSNLTIGDFHNYAVGFDSILVHNTALCDEAIGKVQARLNQGETTLDEIAETIRRDNLTREDKVDVDDALARLKAPTRIITPNAKLQRWAQQGGYIDPRTNKWVKFEGNLAADHVYPKSLIEKLDDFDLLTPQQQEFLLNYPGNFEPLPKSWNSSKLNRLADDWAKTPMGRQASKEYIDALRERQQAFEGFARELIRFWNQ